MLKSFLYNINIKTISGRKFVHFLPLLWFVCSIMDTQGQVTFNTIVNDNNHYWSMGMSIINYDSSYVIIGSGDNKSITRRRIVWAKFDTLGNQDTLKFIGDTLSISYPGLFASAVKNRNSEVVIGGSIVNRLGISNGMLIKLSRNGDSILFKEINQLGFQLFTQMKIDFKKNKYIFSGHSQKANKQSNFWLFVTDTLGNMQLDTTYGTIQKKDEAKCIEVCSDGGYLIGGWTNSYGVPSVDDKLNIWLIKTDSTGQIEWEKVLGDSLSDCAYSIVESKYGGYYVAGCFTEPSNYYLDDFSSAYIAKLDAFGNLIWEKTLDVPTYNTTLLSLIELENGDLIGCGVDSRKNTGGYYGQQGLVIRLDSLGHQIWHRNYNHPKVIFDPQKGGSYNALHDIKPTKDGGFIATGQVNATLGGTYAWLLKLDSMGCLTAGCDTLKDSNDVSVKNEQANQQSINVFPNPASQLVTVNFTGYSKNTKLSLKVISLQGTEVLAKTSTSENGFTIDVSDVANGLYLLYVSDNSNYTHVKKLLVQH